MPTRWEGWSRCSCVSSVRQQRGCFVVDQELTLVGDPGEATLGVLHDDDRVDAEHVAHRAVRTIRGDASMPLSAEETAAKFMRYAKGRVPDLSMISA